MNRRAVAEWIDDTWGSRLVFAEGFWRLDGVKTAAVDILASELYPRMQAEGIRPSFPMNANNTHALFSQLRGVRRDRALDAGML